MLATIAGVCAYEWRTATDPAQFRGTLHMYDTPFERCVYRGVGEFADRGEWPRTVDGRDARGLIEAACAKDVVAFGADEEGAIQH